MSNATLIHTTTTDSTASGLDEVLGGFRQSNVLFAAVELGLFDFTAEPHTVAEIVRRLGLNERVAGPFLDALVGLGLLVRHEVVEHTDLQVYENTTTSGRYLVSTSPQFFGTETIARACRSYCHWNRLTDAIRTGEPQNEFTDGLGGAQQPDPELCNRKTTFDQFADTIDLTARWWSVVAVDAALAVPLAIANPDSIGTVVTTRAAAPGIRAQLVLAGLDGRVSVAECDVFTDKIPPTEVYVVDSLRNYTSTERTRLLERVRSSLARDGVMVVVDDVIDDERRLNAPALLSSLDAVIEGSACLGYTASDFDTWCRAAGFAGTEIAPIAGAASAAIAYTNQEDMS